MKTIKMLMLLSSAFAFANIHLPAIFTDNMVLQRNSEVTIWGNASPKEEITLTADFLDKEYKATTGNGAVFKITFPTPKEGGPYKISLKGYNEIILNNVMLGEVWLVSGQSNMEMSAAWGISDGEKETAEANFPNIRLFTVEKAAAEFPQNNFFGSWTTCTPETMKNFSAVGYFFARNLQDDLKGVPIGIISAAWGGSSAELWTPNNVFSEKKELLENYKKLSVSEYYPAQISSAYNAMISPAKDYKIKGVLWYQGETNTGNPDLYSELLSSMIESWRKERGYEFPFYIVQIAPYETWGFSGAKIRNEQRLTAEKVPQSGLVVISDFSPADDLHPKNKKQVGIRLANLVAQEVYKINKGLVKSPEWKNIDFQKGKAVATLDFADGLYFKNKTSDLFELAGEDGKFYPAKAMIKNNKIIVESPEVKNPVKLRYAWKNTAVPDLFNKANLPASTFSSEYP
ncbi:MAG: sialate O-acetylesterase [Bergeyella sp.]